MVALRSERRIARPQTISVGTTAVRVLGPSPRRRGVIFQSAGREIVRPGTVTAASVDTNTLGVKLTYTAPTGFNAIVHTVSIFPLAGAPTFNVQIGLGGFLTYAVAAGAAQFKDHASGIHLNPGNQLFIECTIVGGLGSISDLLISVQEYSLSAITALGPEPSVTTSTGLVMTIGGPSVVFDREHDGDAVNKAWYAISDQADQVLSLQEVYYDGPKW